MDRKMSEKLPLWLLHLIWWTGFIVLFPLWYWQKRHIQPLNTFLPHPVGFYSGSRQRHLSHTHAGGVGRIDCGKFGSGYAAQGLAAQIAAQLNGNTKQAIHWQCLGGRAINLQKTHHWLIPQVEPLKPDFLVIVLGFNDTWQLTPVSQWREGLYRVIHRVRDNVKQGIFFTLSAPFFSKIWPQPLRFLLDIRRMLLNQTLKAFINAAE
jgi:lysophospholipase L1-like esterase